MSVPFRTRYSRVSAALSLLVGTVLVIGCARSGVATMPGLSTDGAAHRQIGSVPECTPLYSFQSDPDGSLPAAGVVDVKGVLYGTTTTGGTSNLGTVYSVTSSGTEKVLHSFTGAPDGESPYANLIDVGGTLYGTTAGGGATNEGTVFKISPKTGAVSIVYSFKGDPDGDGPSAGLIKVGGVLYGTTVGGGTSSNGTVFSVTTSGTENVLHSFANGSDGATPQASLVYFKGAFFGTTQNGGANGYGTVFKVTRTGGETVLHTFAGSDGATPLGGLVAVEVPDPDAVARRGERGGQCLQGRRAVHPHSQLRSERRRRRSPG